MDRIMVKHIIAIASKRVNSKWVNFMGYCMDIALNMEVAIK